MRKNAEKVKSIKLISVIKFGVPVYNGFKNEGNESIVCRLNPFLYKWRNSSK
jgi:hypothetical protein